MNTKYIVIVLGEPYSVFSEIIGRYFSKYKIKRKKIILVGNFNLFKAQLKKLKYKLILNQINSLEEAKIDKLNIININFTYKKIFTKITPKSNNYIENCFNKSLDLIFSNKEKIILINGPISKKTFLKKKYLGITEYLSKKTNSRNQVMLIYNEKLSVSPITTHIPIKHVTKHLSKKKILDNIININNFYKDTLSKNAKFAVLGLNPHCETVDKYSEEDNIIIPSIKKLKKMGIKVNGPFSADTFFLHKNTKNYDVVVGMYHDQVITPIKTMFNFNAINITLGLPFIRISPDHGPNSSMLGKNLSDPSSFVYAMKFINKIN